MRPYLLALIVIVAAVLIACAPAETAPTDVEPTITGASPAAAEPEDTPILRRENAEVRAVLDKQDAVKGYSFDIANLPDMGAWATYYVRGDKARVDLVTHLDFSSWSADTVYVDFAENTATAYCIDIARCRGQGFTRELDFARYGIELPTDWNERVVYGDRTGGVTFNSRQVSVIRWEEDEKTFEGYLDPFYGVLHRVAVLDLTEEPPAIIGGYEYRNLAFNTVLEEDVIEP